MAWRGTHEVDPMVLSVFRSRLRPEHAEGFQTLADEMMALARAMPGFRS